MIFLDTPIVKDLIKQALTEDIGYGDITSSALFDSEKEITAIYRSRTNGIIAGLPVLEIIFDTLGTEISINNLLLEGDKISPGQDIAILRGNARTILMGERLSLNFLQRMSAIATMTSKFQSVISPYKAKICDTRKSCPNFRIFEKYSVKIGGGSVHRFGLFDGVIIKDNHIKIAGDIKQAIATLRKEVSHTAKIEVETENLKQVLDALEAGADIIMFDNMPVEKMKEAVDLVNGKAITEASGAVTLENVNEIASSGVDYISTSSITAKAGILDIGLDI